MSKSKSFQKNVELWAHLNPKQAVLLPFIDCSGIEFCKTKKGELNLKSTLDGEVHYYHSNSGAAEEANKWFSKLDLRNVQVLYVYGVGLGYYYEAAKNWLEKDPSHFLVFIEDNLKVIHQLFETNLGFSILRDPQVQLHYFTNLQDSKEVFELLYWNFIMTEMKVSALKYYQKVKKDLFNDIHHKIIYDASVKNALLDEYLKYGAAFYKNFYPNMRSLEGAYLGNGLFGKFKKIPAIICGAGPSLGKQLPQLSAFKDKALIFAGGSALNVLNAANIQPHFGAGIDPNPLQFDRLSKNQAFEIPFFYRNRLLHQAFKMIHGPRLYITGSGGYDISEWFEEQLGIKGELLDEGHNVVNFCVEIAYALGCDPIIFVGMDLAYTDMKSYSPGVVTKNKVKKKDILNPDNFDAAALLRKDIYGNPIYTLWKWIAEADWIGDFAKNHSNVSLINSTEGGLGFPQVPCLNLSEAAKKYFLKSFDLNGRVLGEIQCASLPQVKKEKLEKLMEELRQSLIRCIECFKILIEETNIIKQKIKKENNIPTALQTGRAALYEADLAEEIAYQYVLEIFNMAYSRVLNRELYQINIEQTSEKKRMIKKLEINEKRFSFLRDVAIVNEGLLRMPS